MRRLIIVEGLPCSGKSTTAKYIAEKTGMRCFDEGSGRHPADYEFHGFITREELCGFSNAEQEQITRNSAEKSGGFIVPLEQFQGRLLQKLLCYKIYDALFWETEKPIMLNKWREFAANAGSDEGYVFNCVLLQNPMCETMIRFNFDQTVSAGYIGEICKIIAPLDPLVVYLKSNDIRSGVERAIPQRGRDWLSGVIDYHCNGAYGRERQLSGLDGYIAALEERQRRELAILQSLDIRAVIVEDPSRNWEKAYRTIMEQISCLHRSKEPK